MRVLSGGAHEVHDVATFDLLGFLMSEILAMGCDLLFFILNLVALIFDDFLPFLHFLGSHLPCLIDLFSPFFLDLGESEPILSRLLLQAVQLRVLCLQLRQFFLLLALSFLPLKDELSVGLLALTEQLLSSESVGFACLLFRPDALVHLRLLLLDLVELLLDILVFALRLELLLLHLELMGQHLILAARLHSLLFPSLHAFTLAMQDLLMQSLKFLSSHPSMLLLLLLLKLLEKLLVRLKLKVGDHLILHPRFKLVLLLSRDHANFFLDLPVLFIFQPLLLRQRGLDRLLDRLHVLESGFALKLVQPDALLQEGLHLCANLGLSLGFRAGHSLLLQADTLFLLHDLVCFLLDVDQDLVLALDFFLLVHNFLAQPVLKGDEMVRVPREALVAAASAMG